jgi:hypothetical protein
MTEDEKAFFTGFLTRLIERMDEQTEELSAAIRATGDAIRISPSEHEMLRRRDELRRRT